MSVREYKLVKIIYKIYTSKFNVINNKDNNENIYRI